MLAPSSKSLEKQKIKDALGKMQKVSEVMCVMRRWKKKIWLDDDGITLARNLESRNWKK